MLKLLIILCLSHSYAGSDPLFTSVSYYWGLNQKFRVETAQKWPKCQSSNMARKIYLDHTNELREVAYWDAKGQIHEAGKSNNPEVHQIVNETFSQSMNSGNPCEVVEESKSSSTSSSGASEQ